MSAGLNLLGSYTLYISQIFQMQRRSFGLVGNSQLLVKSSQNLCPDM